MKGAHVRNAPDESPEGLLMHSDYTLYQINKIMEEKQNIDAVYYIDVWNMNVAYLLLRRMPICQ